MGKAILFDLDGTLTDSGEGIINCVSLTLEHYGIALPPREELRVFVGPPLHKTFHEFGIAKEDLDEAVTYYRKFYNVDGKYQNYPYPGIIDLLKRLKAEGHKLYVATSKPESISVDILNKFEMSQYFEMIVGSLADGNRDAKSEVIGYVLDHTEETDEAVMVGDTVYDILGANANHISAIAVSWGFGKMEDMIAAGAKAVAHSMEQLYDLLTK